MLIDARLCYRLGIGAPLPTKAADGSWNRTELDSNDKLRKQLLGKNYKRVVAAGAGASAIGTQGQPGVRANLGASAKQVFDDEDGDDDEGRTTTVGTSQRRSKKRKPMLGGSQDLNEATASPGEGQESITSHQIGRAHV